MLPSVRPQSRVTNGLDRRIDMIELQLPRLRSVGFAVCGMLLFAPAAAGSGDPRVPISEPTIITEPGRYVVTNDIDGVNAEYCVISIEADDVDLDLDGHVLDANSATGLCARDVERIAVYDGRLHSDSTDDSDDHDEDVRNLIFENVSNFVVRKIVTLNSGEYSMRFSGCTKGVIEDNEIIHARKGAIISRGFKLALRGNVFPARLSVACEQCDITGNTILPFVSSAGGPAGELRIAGSNNIVADNVLGSATLFETATDNSLRGNLFNAGGGLVVHGQRNRIIGNTMTNAAGFGLTFSASSRSNFYDENVAYGNAGGTCAGSADGTNSCDAGTSNFRGERNSMVPSVDEGD
jgi:hypothetical protein